MPDRPNRPIIFLALAGVLAVAGCGKPGASASANDTAAANTTAPLPSLPATLPMATGPATAAAYAPPVAQLPAARPVRAVRVANSGDAYAYADDAYAFSNALGNAPPDYGFDYQGAEPWAWQGSDDSRTFVEPVSDGYRYYYYRPGADTPYFVRDPDYGYGFDGGALAVIYGAGGAVLPYGDYGPRLGYASRYLQRGAALYAASRGNERRAVNAANWAARQNAIAASRDRWAASQARQAGWQAYRARVADQQAQHWAQEAARRDADAQRFTAWHDDGFRGAAPPRAIPAIWQQAPWAQDQQRYRPVDRPVDRRPILPVSSQPAFQRPAAPVRPAFAPGQGQPPRSVGEGRPDAAAGPRNQGRILQAQPQQATREAQAPAPRQAPPPRQAAAGPQQQLAVRAQERQAEHPQQPGVRAQALQVEHRQRPVAQRAERLERRQPPATHLQRPAERQAPVPVQVQVHREGAAPFDGGRPPRDPQRSPAVQPLREDRRQPDAERPAIQALRQQQAMPHQQAATVQRAPAPQRAPQPTHAAPAPHAPAPHAPAPNPQSGGHGEHRP